MKFAFHLFFLLCIILTKSFSYFSQSRKTIYLIPGQGSDKRIFDSLKLDPTFKIKYLEYQTPAKKTTLTDFSKQLAEKIDTTESFVLIGVSLGGMLASEIAEILHPEKTIIISSAKNKNELPFRYRFQEKFPLYAIFPGFVLLGGAKLLQPLVEPDRKNNKAVFKNMLKCKSGKYMKRTIRMLIKWKRNSNSKEIIHIHGKNDHTIPIRNIQNPKYIVENGSHMITLTRAKEISEIINKELAEIKD